MNTDILEGKWAQLKGEVQKKWGELTDDDLEYIQGEKTKLVGKLQERYGKEKDEIEKELKDFKLF